MVIVCTKTQRRGLTRDDNILEVGQITSALKHEPVVERDLSDIAINSQGRIKPRRLTRMGFLYNDAQEQCGSETAVVDLRGVDELIAIGNRRPVSRTMSLGFSFPHIDFTDDGRWKADQLEASIPVACSAARRTLMHISSGHPTVVGCRLGKDRTAMVISILLFWLGVDKESRIVEWSFGARALYGDPDFIEKYSHWKGVPSSSLRSRWNPAKTADAAEVLDFRVTSSKIVRDRPEDALLDEAKHFLLGEDDA